MLKTTFYKNLLVAVCCIAAHAYVVADAPEVIVNPIDKTQAQLRAQELHDQIFNEQFGLLNKKPQVVVTTGNQDAVQPTPETQPTPEITVATPDKHPFALWAERLTNATSTMPAISYAAAAKVTLAAAALLVAWKALNYGWVSYRSKKRTDSVTEPCQDASGGMDTAEPIKAPDITTDLTVLEPVIIQEPALVEDVVDQAVVAAPQDAQFDRPAVVEPTVETNDPLVISAPDAVIPNGTQPTTITRKPHHSQVERPVIINSSDRSAKANRKAHENSDEDDDLLANRGPRLRRPRR